MNEPPTVSQSTRCYIRTVSFIPYDNALFFNCYSVHMRTYMYNFVDNILIFQNFNYSIIYGCIIDIIVAYLYVCINLQTYL